MGKWLRSTWGQSRDRREDGVHSEAAEQSFDFQEQEHERFNAALFIVPSATSPLPLALNPQRVPEPKGLDHGPYGDEGTRRCPVPTEVSLCAEWNWRIQQEQEFANSSEALPREKWTFPRAPETCGETRAPSLWGESSCQCYVKQ